MSKAVEKAYKAYPLTEDNHLNHERNAKRVGFQQGYEQAEKDLELTCDDIEIIVNAFLDFKIESIKSGKTKRYTNEEYCVEILKRFKERKENAKVNM